MANAVAGSVRIDLTMNAATFERDAGRARNAMAGLGRAIADISSSINRASIFFNTGVMAAQRFASAASGIFNVASAFEKGMSNVSTLVDTSAESMKEMSRQVLEIGKRTPVAIGDLTSALYDIRSAGISAADAMSVLENSARLGTAGLGTTKEAVDLVTSSINAFGLKGDDAAQVYDLIFKTVKAGKTTITELAQGFGAVAGTVATAGIKLDDYLASVAALTTTGLPAAQAHTQLRAAIAGLTRETEETKALFDALNVKTFRELVTQSGSVVVAFQRIVAATRGNDAQIIKLLGSVEAYNALVGLAGRQNQAYVNTLKSMRDGSDLVTEAFNKQNATLASSLQRLRNNADAVATSIGNVLAPTINAIAEKVAGLAKSFTELSPEMQEMIARTIAFVGVVAPSVIALGFFANALAALAPVIMAVVGAFGVFTGVVAGLIAATGPIGLLIAAAGLIAVAWYKFKDDIVGIWNGISSFISTKIEEIIDRMRRFASVISESFSLITSGEFTAAWQRLGESIGGASTNVSEHTKTVQGMAQAWKTTTETTLPDAAAKFNDGFVVPVSKGLSDVEKLWKRHNEEALRFGTQVAKEIATPQEALIAQQWRLRDALDAGGLSAEQYGTAMQKATFVAANAYASMASGIADNLATAFGNSKAFAIAAAIINTAESVTKTLATYGATPWGIAAAAAAAAAGAAQISAIRSTTKSGGGGGGAGASAGTAAAAEQQPVRGVSINLQGDNYSRQSVRDLIAAIGEEVRDGAVLTVA